MRYKEKVLARFPVARTAVTALWPDGSPRHYTILAGNQRLELPVKGASGWWNENAPVSAARAWREAYIWMAAHPDEGQQTDLFDDPSGAAPADNGRIRRPRG